MHLSVLLRSLLVSVAILATSSVSFAQFEGVIRFGATRYSYRTSPGGIIRDVKFNLDSIQNLSGSTTRPLRVELWFAPSCPSSANRGQKVFIVAAKNLGHGLFDGEFIEGILVSKKASQRLPKRSYAVVGAIVDQNRTVSYGTVCYSRRQSIR